MTKNTTKNNLQARSVKGTLGSLEKAWAAYDAAQKRLEKESKLCLSKELRRILGKDKGSVSLAKGLFDDELYDMDIILYEKHGFYETGLPLEVELLENNEIVVICEGCETDQEQKVNFTELTAWSQEGIAHLFSEITKDEYFFLREGDAVTVCERLTEDEINEWFDELEEMDLIQMFDLDKTEDYRKLCKEEFNKYGLESKLEFYHTNQ